MSLPCFFGIFSFLILMLLYLPLFLWKAYLLAIPKIIISFLILIIIIIIYFFLSGFYSQVLTIHRTAGEGRGPSFIPLYHFHPLTNIETFICNFACEMTTRIFNRNAIAIAIATLSNYHLSD